MLTHVIVGKGNLGSDLFLEAKKLGHKAFILSRSAGFGWPESLKTILELQPTHVWVTAGAGSIDFVKSHFDEAVKTHVTMPIEILQQLPPQVNICLFSTDYAADESDPSNPDKITKNPKSLYALTKIWMEEAVKLLNRPNTSVVRVGSLYGAHYPDKTLPGRLRSRFPEPCEVHLPQNWIGPTPTTWIAQVLMRNTHKMFINSPTIHHCGPSSGCSVMSFGSKILGEGYTFKSRGFDAERPGYSTLNCSLEKAPTWEELWGTPWWSKPTEAHLDV